VVYSTATPNRNAFTYPYIQLACDMLRRQSRRFKMLAAATTCRPGARLNFISLHVTTSASRLPVINAEAPNSQASHVVPDHCSPTQLQA
jgi:hypothetical protein